MKKILLTIVMIFGIIFSTQAQSFGEFFMSNALKEQSTVYDSVLTICNDLGIDYVVHHRYDGDPLTSEYYSPRLIALNERTYSLFGNYGPAGFMQGLNLRTSKMANEQINSLLDVQRYERCITINPPLIDSIFSWATVEYINTIDPYFTFNVEIFADTTFKIGLTNVNAQLILIEDVAIDEVLYKNIERVMIPNERGIVYNEGDTISAVLAWDNLWNINNCSIMIVVEDFDYNVIGSKKYSINELLDNTTLSVNTVVLPTITLFPNPVTDILNINGIQSGDWIIMYDISGKTIFKEQFFRTQVKINMNDLSNGIYFFRIQNQIHKIIIN